MRVKQLYSAFGWVHQKKLLEKYNLQKTHNMKEPVLFLGCYGLAQMNKALKWSQTAKVIIWWSGSDCPFFKKHPDIIQQLKDNDNIIHIATVNFIEKDLQDMGLPYKKIPLFSHKIDEFKPAPLGDSIYIYKPGSPIYCGWNVVRRLKKEFPKVPIIEVRNHHVYNFDQIKEIYKKAFLGIRLTKHDGLSHGVAELGLTGRKVIHNGDTPNSVNYDNLDDIMIKIEKIIKHKYNPYNLALRMRRYLDVGEDWLNV